MMWIAQPDNLFTKKTYNDSSKSRSLILSGIFSTLIYAFFFSLLVGIRLVQTTKSTNTKTGPIRKAPAPIKLFPIAPPAEPTPQPIFSTPTTPAPSNLAQQQKNPIQSTALPTKEILQIPPLPQTVQAKQKQTIPDQNIARSSPIQLTKPTQEIQNQKRRGAIAWKQQKTSTLISPPESNVQKIETNPQNVHQEFSEFLEEKNNKTLFSIPTTKTNNGYYSGHSVQEQAKITEDLSFFNHLYYSFSSLSYQNKFSLKGLIIRPHTIILTVAIKKDRGIGDIHWTQPSPIPLLNRHISYLLKQLTPPLLPAHYSEKELLVPLRIEVHGDQSLDGLYFIPVQ